MCYIFFDVVIGNDDILFKMMKIFLWGFWIYLKVCNIILFENLLEEIENVEY